MRSSNAAVCSAMALVIASGCAAGCAKNPPALAVTAPAPPANPLQQLGADIDALIEQPGHQHGIWAIVVYSLARNERLYEHNSGTLLVPASTAKIVSLAAAAEAVGWDYAFETRLLATGAVVNGILQGDLV